MANEDLFEEDDEFVGGFEDEDLDSGGIPRRGARRRAPGGARRRFSRRPKACSFCSEAIKQIDYKESDMLRRFLSERGKIRPRRQTGTCAKHQRALARAVKRARYVALLPYTDDHVRET